MTAIFPTIEGTTRLADTPDDHRVDSQSVLSTQNAYGQPVNLQSTAQYNLQADFLTQAGNYPLAETTRQPPLEPDPVFYERVRSTITPENWMELANEAIAREERITGRVIENAKAVAIVGAYRELAGLPSHDYTFAPDGSKDFAPAVKSSQRVLDNPNVKAAVALQSTLDSVEDSIGPLPSLAGLNNTVQLVAAVAIIGGVIWLSR